jgi:NAD(P)-dependent dehydrogenase (short-subunit alcohol dehydrogenase family)
VFWVQLRYRLSTLLQWLRFFERFNATCIASKACELNLPLSLNAEFDGTGVKVQAVLPGVRRTEIRERSGIDVSQIPGKLNPREDFSGQFNKG